MSTRRHKVNYSIEGIAQSIVKDHPVARKFSSDDKRRLFRQRLSLLEDMPELSGLLGLDHIHTYANSYAAAVKRLAVIPPEIVVVDSRIQDMCYLPHWTYYGSGEGTFGRCASIGVFSCCPPFSPPAERVQARLDKADLFVVMQTKLRPFGAGVSGDAQRTVNILAGEINGLLGKGSVVQKYGAGPCFGCYPEMCECEGKCRAPEKKVPALESLGICVDQLCKDCAQLTGDSDWLITWIKGFGSDHQKPKQLKTTVAVAIKMNGGSS